MSRSSRKPAETHAETAETPEILPNDVEESTAIPPIETQEAEERS